MDLMGQRAAADAACRSAAAVPGGPQQRDCYTQAAALNHVVRGFNTSAELALPQLTLTNNAWNLDRLVSVECVVLWQQLIHQ